MAKFIAHGIIIEEPIRKTTNKGVDVITIKLEERYSNMFGETLNTFSIDFVGKAVNCIPINTKLRGAHCICVGQVRSRGWNDKFYNDLSGEQFTLIAPQPFDEGAPNITPAQADPQPLPEIPQDDDDDLPF